MKALLRSITILLLLFAATMSFAQVAVSTDGSSADASAMLEVKSTDKGLLIPRVALTGTNDLSTISSPATSLIVYNTATVSGENAIEPGFYFFSGVKWEVMTYTNGNHWTRDLNNNYTYLTISEDNVGINVSDPSSKLEVNGDISTGDVGIKWKSYSFTAGVTGGWTSSGISIDVDKTKILSITGSIRRAGDNIVKAMGSFNGTEFLVYVRSDDKIMYFNEEWPGTVNVLIYYTE